MKLSQIKAKLQPKITKPFEEKIKKAHQERNEQPQVKPLFKMKIFNGVESKVMQRLSQEKQKLNARTIYSSQQTRPKFNQEFDNIDNLIDQVQEEIKQLK